MNTRAQKKLDTAIEKMTAFVTIADAFEAGDMHGLSNEEQKALARDVIKDLDGVTKEMRDRVETGNYVWFKNRAEKIAESLPELEKAANLAARRKMGIL